MVKLSGHRECHGKNHIRLLKETTVGLKRLQPLAALLPALLNLWLQGKIPKMANDPLLPGLCRILQVLWQEWQHFIGSGVQPPPDRKSISQKSSFLLHFLTQSECLLDDWLPPPHFTHTHHHQHHNYNHNHTHVYQHHIHTSLTDQLRFVSSLAVEIILIPTAR